MSLTHSVAANLESYIQSFSKDAREIFEHFKFIDFIGLLNDANLLYKIVQKVRTTDLSPMLEYSSNPKKPFECKETR